MFALSLKYNNMKKIFTLLTFITLVISKTSFAVWTVGLPVKDTLAATTFYVSNCGQGASETVHFTCNMNVAGVVMYAKIMYMTSNSIFIPNNPMPLQAGDSLILTPGVTSISFGDTSANGGVMRIAIFAAGIPTNAGDIYPCQQVNIWMSDMGICPENISATSTPACAVQASVGVTEIKTNSENYFANPIGDLVTLKNNTFNSIEIFDATGKSILKQTITNQQVNTATLTTGIYFVRLMNNTTKEIKTIKAVKL
jgi:hypothetical protein